MKETQNAFFLRKAYFFYVSGQRFAEAQQYEEAVSSYEQALSIKPDYFECYLGLARALYQCQRWDDLLQICEQGLAIDIGNTELQTRIIDVIVKRDGIDAAFARYRLQRKDQHQLEIAPHEILFCSVIRNELSRLPFLLEYYRDLGVNRFFFVDNGSVDESMPYLISQPDTHVWQSDLDFAAATFGSAWFELLMRRYGIGHWWVMADADELLVFADSEKRSLVEFCDMLERNGKVAASGILLDLYGKLPISETIYETGQDYREVCHYFDRVPIHSRLKLDSKFGNQDHLMGGARQRVFPTRDNYLLTKTPLLHYSQDTILISGQHTTNAPREKIAHDVCAVLHFKFFSSFLTYARQEADREQHANQGAQYKAYMNELDANKSVSLYDNTQSIRYEDTAQLIRFGILKSEPGNYVGDGDT